MKNKRTIRQQWYSQKVRMGSILLDQPLPVRGIDQIDPFLLVHHWADELPGGQHQSEVGVGPHPHRGFAPVTLIFKGSLHHRDSEGNSDIVRAGGTQWMNSGAGIIHSERPDKDLAAAGGAFEIIQFWVNAPAARKMDQPSYQPLQKGDMPTITSRDGKVEIGVVAGEYEGVKAPIQAYSDLLILRLDLKAGGKTKLSIPARYNACLYQLDGSLRYNSETETGTKAMVWLNNDGDRIEIEALEDTRVAVWAGVPLEEPVSTYGPFVMNTEQEIVTAIQDYQNGVMGELVETFD